MGEISKFIQEKGSFFGLMGEGGGDQKSKEEEALNELKEKFSEM